METSRCDVVATFRVEKVERGKKVGKLSPGGGVGEFGTGDWVVNGGWGLARVISTEGTEEELNIMMGSELVRYMWYKGKASAEDRPFNIGESEVRGGL